MSRWANWPARRGCAGRLRSALSAPRTISVSTIARRAPGTGGTGTGACAWPRQPSWPGWPPTCVGRHGAKRTNGVRRSQRPPDEPRGASADSARDPLSSGPTSAQAPNPSPLYHGLVALATKTPSQQQFSFWWTGERPKGHTGLEKDWAAILGWLGLIQGRDGGARQPAERRAALL